MKLTLKFIRTCGQGYLVVPVHKMPEELLNDISSRSWVTESGNWYLEEDCDMRLYVRHMERRCKLNVRVTHQKTCRRVWHTFYRDIYYKDTPTGLVQKSLEEMNFLYVDYLYPKKGGLE